MNKTIGTMMMATSMLLGACTANSGDVMVEFEGDDGEMTTKHMCDVVTDPNDYEKIANAIHDCLYTILS